MSLENDFLILDDLPDGLLAGKSGATGRLIFNRPQKRNALTQELWLAIPDAVLRLADDTDVRVIVVEGAGDTFCAGADISEFSAVRRNTETALAYETANAEAFRSLSEAPVPVIAAIRGIAFGGGFGLAASCDIRIATGEAEFAVPAAKLGLAYPVEAMADIVDAIGVQNTKALFFTARRFSAAAMKEQGFLYDVVASQDFPKMLSALIDEIATNAPLTHRATKAAIRATYSGSADDIDRAKKLGDATFESDDYSEGLNAFTKKRKPEFTGF